MVMVEDSAHTYAVTSAVLQFFDPLLITGDYIVVEDGIVRNLPDKIYRHFDDGPNRAVSEFLQERLSAYGTTEACAIFLGIILLGILADIFGGYNHKPP